MMQRKATSVSLPISIGESGSWNSSSDCPPLWKEELEQFFGLSPFVKRGNPPAGGKGDLFLRLKRKFGEVSLHRRWLIYKIWTECVLTTLFNVVCLWSKALKQLNGRGAPARLDGPVFPGKGRFYPNGKNVQNQSVGSMGEVYQFIKWKTCSVCFF